MKPMTRALVFSGAGVVAVIAGWTASVYYTTGAQSKMYAVELVPQGVSGTLKVNKANQCKQNKHEGCLLFEEDKIGLIKFYLVGSKFKVEKCPKAKSVITRIELTTTADPDPANTNAEKGQFSGNLPPWVKDDAFPGVISSTGVVYDAAWNVARTQAWLVNMNSHDATGGEKQFWYKVTATSCSDQTKQWKTDPRGDNKGTKL